MAKEEELKKAADAELKTIADAEAARIMASDEGSNAESSPLIGALGDLEEVKQQAEDNARSRAMEAAALLELIARSYPTTTPDEHTVFGFGGHKCTLGDMRALFNLKK